MKAVFGTAPSTNGFLVEYEATVASAKILGIQSEFAVSHTLRVLGLRLGDPVPGFVFVQGK